jgi:hypothetical protein
MKMTEGCQHSRKQVDASTILRKILKQCQLVLIFISTPAKIISKSKKTSIFALPQRKIFYA